MRKTALALLAAAGVLGWGLAGSSVAAVKSPEELQKDQQIKSGQGAQPYDEAKDKATQDQTGGQAATTASPSSQSGAAAAGSPESQSGAATAASPESQSGAETASSPSSTTGAQTSASPGTSGASQVSDEDLRKHVEAHMALRQKAPDVVAKLRRVHDPNNLSQAVDRQELERALQGTGTSADEFIRVHTALLSDSTVLSRFQQIMAQARGGQQPSGATSGTTSGAQPSMSPDASGAQPSGAQPGASPQ